MFGRHLKHSIDDANFYKATLLEYLQDQNEKSIWELGEINPHFICAQEYMKEWYQSLLSCIQAKPPEYWVRCLHIGEGYNGNITDIWYDYQTDDSKTANISVMIHCVVVHEEQ